MSEIALCQATFPDAETAEQIARQIVEERLAACANVMASCVSIYRWKDEIAQEVEVPVLFKTRIALAEPLVARIGELHPYDLPVVECWIAEAGEDVAQWVADATDASG